MSEFFIYMKIRGYQYFRIGYVTLDMPNNYCKTRKY